MDRIYDFQAPVALDWLAHGQEAWNDGGRSLKKRRLSKDVGSGYASILQPLTRLVRESLDAVHNVTEAIATLNVGGYADGFSEEQIRLIEEDRERLIQSERLRAAKAHGQWVKAAKELDALDGCHEWKAEDESDLYDHEDLKCKLENLESAKDNEDLSRMLRVIRMELGRDVAGIGNPKLYDHSRFGTKDLIERYVATAVDTIESAMRLAAKNREGSVAGDVRQNIVETRRSYGRTGLLLSGGGTMGMMHIGVVKAMFEAGVLPKVISGASAGSIVAAVVCTRTDAEIPTLLAEFCNDLDVFTKGEHEAKWSSMIYRIFNDGVLYDIKNLENVMEGHVKDMTFQEAYYRTQRILSIAVSYESEKEEPLVLNYITAPHVLIRSAVAASCSVPFIYKPAPLLERNPDTKKIQRFGGEDTYFIDGSVSHDIPLARLRAMLDVNHFIVSQVNPHIVPFLRAERVGLDAPSPKVSWPYTLAEFARVEFVRRLRQISDIPIPAVRKLTHIGSSILEQTYTGDITILPKTSFSLQVLMNPTPEFMADAMAKGERATWPELDRIERSTAVERVLEKSVQIARERVVFSDSQVDLRLKSIRRQSTASKLRSGRGRSTAGHRVTESMILTGSKKPSAYSSTMSLPQSRSSSEDGMHMPGSPSDFTSSSPQNSDSDESEDEAEDFRRRLRKNNKGPVPNWPYGSLSQSQPTTPSIASKAFNFSPSGPSSPVLTHAATFAMTPASPAAVVPSDSTPNPPSSPELRYRSMFKNFPFIRNITSKSPKAPTVADEQVDSSNASPEARRRSPSVARRGRRSTSTGLKGLKPPGRQ
jgi:TAG lipase/steryl ester hydrolase/phospholipase A2/LPA acyltransferase